MRISSGKYRSGKGNLFAACPVHFLTSRTIGNVYICPVHHVCVCVVGCTDDPETSNGGTI